MKKFLVRAFWALVVVFLLYWMFTDPRAMAEATRETFNGLADIVTAIFEGLIDFFSALTG